MSCPFHSNTPRSLWQKLKAAFSFKKADDRILQAILDTTVDAIVTINEKKQIEAFNKAAEHLFGFTQAEVIGKNVHILMPEPFHSAHDGYVDHYLKTGEKKIIGIGREIIAQRKDGSTFPVSLAVSEVTVNRKRLFTGIIRDITHEKEAEALQKKNILIEAEFIAKNTFISILTHELRTPIAAIYGALKLLLQERDFSEQVKELLNICHRNAEHLANLIKDALDIGKCEVGALNMTLKSTPLVPLITEAIATSQLIANTKRIALVNKMPPVDISVSTDYDRLIQVILNLLSNAIKFSPIGSEVIISLQVLQDTVRVSIEDHGPGIPKAFQDKLFHPFSQANLSHKKLEGTGLGLHMSKAIIDRLGGSIGFTTKEGVGTTFYFELPLAKKS